MLAHSGVSLSSLMSSGFHSWTAILWVGFSRKETHIQCLNKAVRLRWLKFILVSRKFFKKTTTTKYITKQKNLHLFLFANKIKETFVSQCIFIFGENNFKIKDYLVWLFCFITSSVSQIDTNDLLLFLSICLPCQYN